MRNIKANPRLIVCPKTKQFTDLLVCAAACEGKCLIYKQSISFEMLLDYIEKHPEYEITGEIMATEKTKNDQKYWILGEDKVVTEVTEKEIMKNPQNYLTKEIWQKPPFKFEVVITLRKIKAD
ncbi:MAG: hypothetical protein JW784_01145 [Candidatus Cloacimonetes bacterium]|nr:hypothetical protein [Candidatus Cloacimonadota bacterium]